MFIFGILFIVSEILKNLKDLSQSSDAKTEIVRKKTLSSSDTENDEQILSREDGSRKNIVKALGPTIRKKKERSKLKARECKDCDKFWRSMNLSEEELKRKLHKCSRHRANVSPPKTPEHFWDTDFPDISECKRRGYISYK